MEIENYDYDDETVILVSLLEKLAMYEVLQKSGYLFVFPCKVGDTVFFIRKDGGSKPYIVETQVEKVGVRKSGIFIKLSCNKIYETSASSIGETVFFNREDALNHLVGFGG